MYKIGEFSVITGLPVKTLRFYDEIGILKPGYVDEYTNYRYYTDENILDVKRIEEYKSMVFKLEEIKFVLENGLNMDILDQKQIEIQNQINTLIDAYGKIDTLRQTLRSEAMKKEDVKVRQLVKKD